MWVVAAVRMCEFGPKFLALSERLTLYHNSKVQHCTWLQKSVNYILCLTLILLSCHKSFVVFLVLSPLHYIDIQRSEPQRGQISLNNVSGCNLLLIYLNEIYYTNMDLRIFNVQHGLPSPAESSFTPVSSRSLLLRSTSLRLEFLEVKTEAKASQLLHVSLQPLSLKKKK